MPPEATYAVAITTAPRPRPTLGQTVASLERAGFAGQINVLADPHRHAWNHWRSTVRWLLGTYPDADRLLICQDDVLFCRGLREYLDAQWPACDRLGFVSAWCPAKYGRPGSGWHRRDDRGGNLCGAVCLVIPWPVACQIVTDLAGAEWTGGKLGRRFASAEEKQRCCIDGKLGSWAAEHGRSVWYHSPSLVDHLGESNSALASPPNPEARRAAAFVGEEWTPSTLAAKP